MLLYCTFYMIFHAVVIVLSTGIRGNDNRKVTLLVQCKEAAVVAYQHSWFCYRKSLVYWDNSTYFTLSSRGMGNTLSFLEVCVCML